MMQELHLGDGWIRVARLVTINLLALSGGTARFTPDNEGEFLLEGIANASTGAYTFGIATTMDSFAVVDPNTPKGAFFFANDPVTGFRRLLTKGHSFVITATDTSNAVNAVTFVLHGLMKKP